MSVDSARILLVEDEDDLRQALGDALAADGHEVVLAANGSAALDVLAEESLDLVLLDVALPAGPDGVEVCRRLRRADSDLYVMMLTARDSEPEVVVALEAGADDYVTKPIGIVELRTRVRAVLRRLSRGAGRPDGPDDVLRHGPLQIDAGRHRVSVADAEVALTQSEFALLVALVQENGRVVTRQRLLQAVFGDDAYRDPRTIDFHVHHAREKLAAAGAPELITTVRGSGYRLAA